MVTKFLLFSVLLGVTMLIQQSVGNMARTCYTCRGLGCLRTTLRTERKCSDSLDYCVTVFDKFQVIQKGCSLELPAHLRRRCDGQSDTVECHKSQTDRCNALGPKSAVCLECDAKMDSNCSENPQNITASRCNIATAPNTYCYVKYDELETNVALRGCAISVAEQMSCLKNARCKLCLPGDIQGCNNNNFLPASRHVTKF